MNLSKPFKLTSLYVFFILIPITYIMGNALINSFIILSIFLSFKLLYNNKLFNYEKKILYTFIIFYIYLQINTFLINSEYSNILSSFSYIRFFLFSFVIISLLNLKIISLKNISFIFMSISLFVAMDIIYQYFFNENIFGYKPGICTYPKGVPTCERFSGVFGDELIGGSFLANFGIFSLCLYIYCNAFFKKQIFISLIFGLIIFMAIIISGERGALLTIIYCLVFYTLFSKDLRSYLLKIILLTSIIFILMISLSNNVKHRFIDWPYSYLTGFPGNNLFTKYLHTSWGGHFITAYTIFSENILFGTGIRSFRIVCNFVDKDKMMIKHNIDKTAQPKDLCSTHPHNFHIELLSDLGLIGFVLINISLYFILLDKYFFTKSLNQRNKNIALFILILISANFIPFRPTGSIFSTIPGYNMWFLIGFYLYFVNKLELNEKKK